jgi:hypothetical protein
MNQLDYWAEKRNQLIHSAKGVSRQRMQEVWEEDKRLVQQNQMKNEKIKRYVGDSCPPEEIRLLMANIARCTLELTENTQSSSLASENLGYLQDPDKEPYYLYSQVRDWVIGQLQHDS